MNSKVLNHHMIQIQAGMCESSSATSQKEKKGRGLTHLLTVLIPTEM